MDMKTGAMRVSVEESSRLRAQQMQEPGEGGRPGGRGAESALSLQQREGGVAWEDRSQDREEPNHHRLRERSLDFILKGMEGLLGAVAVGGPVFKTLPFHHRGCRIDPWSGN